MLKKEPVIKAIEKVFHKYVEPLKVAFITAAARGGNFPIINWGDFNQFCIEADIYDKRGAKTANIDRIFIAVD